MKILLQRVNYARVTVNQEIVGQIEKGLLLLVGIGKNDNDVNLKILANKVLNLRIFGNEQGRIDKSVLDIGGEILMVPQFTLYADTSKGRRPEFFSAMEPIKAKEFTEKFVEILKASNLKIEQGIFGADMKVSLENDGPVTIMLES